MLLLEEVMAFRKKVELQEIQTEIDYWQNNTEILEGKYKGWVINEMPYWLRNLTVDMSGYREYQKKIRSLQIQKAIKENGKQIGFSPAELETARERSISDFYGEGKTRTVCPFHNAKTPSTEFAIYGNTAHCFSCGWTGDTIKFIMEKENLSFPQAVKFLL